jgi:ATP-binding cassette, subfamily B, bacterial
MIEGPGILTRYRENEVTWQQVRPGTARRVWPYLRRYRGAMVLLAFMIAVDSAIVVASPLILRLIIDDGILRHQDSVVVALALAVAGLALVDAGAEYVRSRYSQWIGESLVLELRASMFRHVLRQPLAFFTRAQTGSLVSRLDDINETQQAVGALMSQSLSVLLNLILVLTAMFWLSWQLSLVALVVIPLFVLPGKPAGKRAQRLLRQEMQLHGELSAMMAERSDVSGALLAMLYGRPEEDAGVFTRKASRIRDLAVANVAGMELFFASITVLAALVTALVYGLGGTLVIHGVFQLGTLVAFIALVSQLYRPLDDVSRLPLEVLTALVSFDRVFEILDLEPLITERPAAYPLAQAREAPGVEVAGVWFRYPEADQVSLASLEPAALGSAALRSAALPAPERPGDAWVLRDITFTVPAGKLTALVGPSGAGKTTITHLVPRLYDPVRGAVRIGGHDVRDLTLESLRSVIGVVPQDAHLFHDTIRANLLYARPSATENELTEACQAARIWELISSLPDGLDTIAGDRGYRFSGGEKQRLALARLLLKAPSVVVLDEATAHLDSESEAAIQRALATALAGRTSLVIAHRLSTVRAADQILVVDGGQIVERGTHEELLAASGVYAGLYRTQFAPQAALRSLLEEWHDIVLSLTPVVSEVPSGREVRVADGAGEVAVAHEVALRALGAAPEGELVGEPAGMRHPDPVQCPADRWPRAGFRAVAGRLVRGRGGLPAVRPALESDLARAQDWHASCACPSLHFTGLS